MANKQFDVSDLGIVHVYKRRGARNIRLSVNSDGKIRVSIPTWLPYQAGLTFALQKKTWLQSQNKRDDFVDGQRFGKYHTLHIQERPGSTKVETRLKELEAMVYYPPSASRTAIQTAAHAVCKRAAKAEAEKLLPQRLNDLAGKYGFKYNSVGIRHLKTRWGSCSSKHAITLNYYLMQLPWNLIDYVLVHELAHTQELNHGPDFWQVVQRCLPDFKIRRQQLKDFQPSLLSSKA
jgi:predicted metal-dependent hydrolase